MSAPSAALRRGYGLVFLAILTALFALSIALYQKRFTPVTTLVLETGRAGNQMREGADVKIRGVQIGEVRRVSTTGAGARLELALDPNQVRLVGAEPTAMLLPKTLFGEKYVAITPGGRPGPPAPGSVIGQDRSATARETEQALNDLLPLLRTLRPQELSTTLNAVSGALRGRGDRIGGNLELVDRYLREINPEVPELGENFALLADVADTYADAAPDLIATLDNLAAVSRSLVDQEQELAEFLTSTATASDETEAFLATNESRLVRLAEDSLPPLSLYAKYSPIFPCLTEGLTRLDKPLSDAFGGGVPGLYITLEFGNEQGGYLPGDEPAYAERRGPTCRTLPDPPRPFPDFDELENGYCDEEERADPGRGCPRGRSGPADEPARALVGSGRNVPLSDVLASLLEVPGDEVPDIAALMFGPLATGAEVGLRSGPAPGRR